MNARNYVVVSPRNIVCGPINGSQMPNAQPPEYFAHSGQSLRDYDIYAADRVVREAGILNHTMTHKRRTDCGA